MAENTTADADEVSTSIHPAALEGRSSDEGGSTSGAAHPSAPKGIAYRILYGGLKSSVTGGLGGEGE